MSDEQEMDIIVVGKREKNDRAVWDRHPNHPANYDQAAGEVFISDMRPYNVFRSPGISQKIGERELRELSDRVASQRMSEFEETQAEKNKVREQALETAQANAVLVPPGAPVVAHTEPTESEKTEAEEDEDEEKQENEAPSRAPRRPVRGTPGGSGSSGPTEPLPDR